MSEKTKSAKQIQEAPKFSVVKLASGNKAPPYISQDAWDEACEELEKSTEREREFFLRHGFDYGEDSGTQATPAHRDWVSAVEREHKESTRVHIECPLGRKAFTLGWLMRDKALIAYGKEVREAVIEEALAEIDKRYKKAGDTIDGDELYYAVDALKQNGEPK